MQTTAEFTWKLSDGRSATLKGTYVSTLVDDTADADGDIVVVGKRISTYGSELIAYVDGKKVDVCRNPEFWRIINTSSGAKKIWGLPIGFANDDTVSAYCDFLASLMQDAPEVVAHKVDLQKKEDEKQRKGKIRRCKAVVNAAEKGRIVASEEEARRRAESWNNVVNEGGYGYVPLWVTQDEYDTAVAYLNQHKGE